MNRELAELARKHFGVKLPVDRAVLKKAYRREALRLHPDAGMAPKTTRRNTLWIQ